MFEKETTRKERLAKSREKRHQKNDMGGEVWSCVWSIGRDQSDDTPAPLAELCESGSSDLSLGPEPVPLQERPLRDRDRFRYNDPLQHTDPLRHGDPIRDCEPTEICPVLARDSAMAAKKADTEGDWHTALEHYAVAIENESSDPQVYFRMGVLLRQTHGDLRQSLAYLRQATLFRPEQLKYRSELADLYETLGFPINARRQREEIRRLEAAVKVERTRRRV